MGSYNDLAQLVKCPIFFWQKSLHPNTQTSGSQIDCPGIGQNRPHKHIRFLYIRKVYILSVYTVNNAQYNKTLYTITKMNVLRMIMYQMYEVGQLCEIPTR